MGIYYTKESLYKEVANIKKYLGFEELDFNIDLINYCKSNGILVETLPYKTKGLRGMAILGDDNNKDIILLNKNRTRCEQNYDCAHETIHLCIHRKVGLKTFNCFNKVAPNQNPFLEWHANEGAAEFFVPYKTLLPLIRSNKDYLTDYRSIDSFKLSLSEKYSVPEAVINYRLENLKYEIYQYLQGTSIDDIEILSLKQQQQRNINIKSLNNISDEDFSKNLRKFLKH